MTQKTETSATCIYKVTVKETGITCYAVPSDSHPGTYYITCWNADVSAWTCTCLAGQHQRACKHARAAQVSVVANLQVAKPAPISERGSLNGNQGFSLMKR